jgi:hypothetical protein
MLALSNCTKNIDVTAKMAAQKAEWGLPFPQNKNP